MALRNFPKSCWQLYYYQNAADADSGAESPQASFDDSDFKEDPDHEEAVDHDAAAGNDTVEERSDEGQGVSEPALEPGKDREEDTADITNNNRTEETQDVTKMNKDEDPNEDNEEDEDWEWEDGDDYEYEFYEAEEDDRYKVQTFDGTFSIAI